MDTIYTLDASTDEERTIAIAPVESSHATHTRYRITLDPDSENPRVLFVDAKQLHSGALHLLTDAQHSFHADPAFADDTWTVALQGRSFKHHVLNPRRLRQLKASGSLGADSGPELFAPMAGKVIARPVSVGSNVSVGDVLLVVEAMKMENDIKAHRDGVLTALAVEVGEAVDVGALLLRVDDPQE